VGRGGWGGGQGVGGGGGGGGGVSWPATVRTLVRRKQRRNVELPNIEIHEQREFIVLQFVHECM